MEVEHLNNREIQRICEARPAFPAMQLHQHPVKNAEALFLSEVLYRVIQEKEANRPLFNYVYHAIRSPGTVGRTAVRYAALRVLTGIGVPLGAAKVVGDGAIYVVGYPVQRRAVFRERA